MDTEWGPDVFDSEYVERVQPMKFEKYARVPKEFSSEKKSKDRRLVLDPLWAWRGYVSDENGLTEAHFDNNDFQILGSYDYNTIDKIRSGYGSARDVFTKVSGETLKRNIETLYVEELLNMAKPGMTPQELHEGVINNTAEKYLKDEFAGYLKENKIRSTDRMNSIMLDIAKTIHLFDYSRCKDFDIKMSHIFAEASHPFVVKQ
jgi:hypothetical protein